MDATPASLGSLKLEEPPRGSLRIAAVSVIISQEFAPSVLLIKRAEHRGDPWSGQIAVPGGKMQPEDVSVKDTAVRETREEVGFDLDETGKFLGYGELAMTHTGSMQVIPAVFSTARRPPVTLNQEATSFRWVSVQDLQAPEASSRYVFRRDDYTQEMPAYVVGDYVIWGLTYRILEGIFRGASPGRQLTPR